MATAFEVRDEIREVATADLGPDWHARHTDRSREARNAQRQLEASATTSSSPFGKTHFTTYNSYHFS